MPDGGYFVSFHHRIPLDYNLPPLACLFDEETQDIVRGARGVLMPKYLSPTRYRKIAGLAKSHFPDLSARFTYRGKAAQVLLFRRLGIPHPDTVILDSPAQAFFELEEGGLPMELPFVLKGDSGGGGYNVYPVESRSGYTSGLMALPPDEPVLVQRWVKNGGMDLRVVVVGNRFKSYFRVGGESFYNNVSRGAKIDYGLHPERQKAGVEMALSVSRAACIGVAGFDVMFPEGDPPLMIEVNFFFGRKGLGGQEGYDELFLDAVMEWKRGLQQGRGMAVGS